MRRIILDTNIYGLIVEDPNRDIVRYGIEKKKVVIVYNLPLIRKELRDTPRYIRFEGENLRNYLLIIYDQFTIIKKNLSSKPNEFTNSLNKIRVVHMLFNILPHIILFFWFFVFHNRDNTKTTI